jgi:hypothetical protein
MDDFISWEEECALMDLVTASIVKRYNGPLERQGMGCQGDIFYTPVDLDQIRELLATLWGEFLKGDTLENALLIIDEEGCTDWSHGYEEEDAIKAAFDADWAAENVPPLTY